MLYRFREWAALREAARSKLADELTPEQMAAVNRAVDTDQMYLPVPGVKNRNLWNHYGKPGYQKFIDMLVRVVVNKPARQHIMRLIDKEPMARHSFRDLISRPDFTEDDVRELIQSWVDTKIYYNTMSHDQDEPTPTAAQMPLPGQPQQQQYQTAAHVAQPTGAPEKTFTQPYYEPPTNPQVVMPNTRQYAGYGTADAFQQTKQIRKTPVN